MGEFKKQRRGEMETPTDLLESPASSSAASKGLNQNHRVFGLNRIGKESKKKKKKEG